MNGIVVNESLITHGSKSALFSEEIRTKEEKCQLSIFPLCLSELERVPNPAQRPGP